MKQNLLLFITAWVLYACHQESAVVNLPYVRLDPGEIVLQDSSGTNIDPALQRLETAIRIDTIDKNTYHITVSFSSDTPVLLNDLRIPIRFLPDNPSLWKEVKHSFHWVPHLKKNESQIMAQHAFQSPAIVLTHGKSAISVIPDLTAMNENKTAPHYLDLKFGDDGVVALYGISHYTARRHVYYERKDSSYQLPGKMGLYVISSSDSSPAEILQATSTFMWDTFAKPNTDSLAPQVLPFTRYADAGYAMAFDKYWVDGPGGMGGITLSTFFDSATQVYRGRDSKDDLWFHSWFNNARTAYGLYEWGTHANNQGWKNKALATMKLLMSSPQTKGFFPTIWANGKNEWVASGQGGGPDLYHVPDNAWTAIWLLRFDDELQRLPGANAFLVNFAEGLIKTQLPNGSFPARIRVSDLKPDSVLANSASGSMATWFLEEMILRKKLPATTDADAKAAVRRSLTFLEKEILPNLRFEDYEVFFSCAPNKPGDFDSLTWSFPHNTLSIQWSAEAFLKAYQLSNDKRDLTQALYCLSVLSLYQQVWNPSFIDFYAFGGFGVQNTDAEWSDARQAQFAETYLNFFLATGDQEYLERSIAACRASFALMAIPENKVISPQNYKGTTYNGEFTGAMAENFGHSGYNRRSGQSGFHWGTGSALTTAAILKTKLGDIYVDARSRKATGVDGIVVRQTRWGDTLRLVIQRLPGTTALRIRSDQAEMIGRKVIIEGEEGVLEVE